jgi:thiamine biosynthesis lipoprotein
MSPKAFAGCWQFMLSPLPAADLGHVRRARPLLGTRVEIVVKGRGTDTGLHTAVDAAFARIGQVHALMSYQDPDSDLSRLNRGALKGPQWVNAHTYRVCEAALQIASLSEGAFDPTVAPQLESCGLLPPSELPWDRSASWRDIELSGGERVRFHRPLRLDLGGIAKGYAVDLAVSELQRFDLETVLVNAGGDLRLAGRLPQWVHIRHPQHPLRSAHMLALQNAALATSAAYFSRRGAASALVNARSGTPYLGDRSVSVRANECMAADALTKVVLFAPESVASACLAAYAAQAYILQ